MDYRSISRPTWIVAALFTAILSLPSSAAALDADCDGIDDSTDNCPAKFNPTQDDTDGDLAGDRCDTDRDGDSVLNDTDNCPKAANADQTDSDGDAAGDTCDQCAGTDGNEAVNRQGCSVTELCPCDGPEDDQAWRSHGQYLRCVKKKARHFRIRQILTADEFRVTVDAARGNSCGEPAPVTGDNDGDGVADDTDNCPSDSNPSQRNTDGDAFGDACDSDKDDDTVVNASDNCPLVANAAGQSDDTDFDGVGDACDTCSDSDASDFVDRDGCSLDQACPCEADADGNPWAGHRKYLRCYFDEVFRFKLLDIINGDEADALKDEARASDCGRLPPMCQ